MIPLISAMLSKLNGGLVDVLQMTNEDFVSSQITSEQSQTKLNGTNRPMLPNMTMVQ